MQDDVARRLLERLEQRVGGRVVHRVGALEHEHAPGAPRTACATRRPRRTGRRRRAASRARRSGRPRSGRGASRAWARARALAGRAPSRESSSAANSRAASRLPEPAGPWNRYACDGRPSQRGAEHGGGVGMGLEDAARRMIQACGSVTRAADHGRGARRRRQDHAGGRADARARRARARAARAARAGRGRAVRAHPRARQGPGAARRPARRGAALRGGARAARRASSCVPLLDAGEWVLLDRFVDSSLAYQGAGRGLGHRGDPRAQRVRHRRPDRPTARCCCGSIRRSGARGIAGREADRLERRARRSSPRSARAYDALAAAEPERFAVIEADRAPRAVLADALAALDLLAAAPEHHQDEREQEADRAQHLRVAQAAAHDHRADEARRRRARRTRPTGPRPAAGAATPACPPSVSRVRRRPPPRASAARPPTPRPASRRGSWRTGRRACPRPP